MADDATRSRLGRGLAALMGDVGDESQSTERAKGQRRLPVEFVRPNPRNPRRTFPENELEELAASVKERGIIQPILVRAVRGAHDAYEIIAGERRWRAAQRAQLLRVPVVVREVGDEQALELTLVENIQREDLNPIEQARAFQRLMDQFHLTQDEVATRTGKDRATVANSVRLLTLNETFLEWIEEGKITAGHGRALLAIDDPKLRLDLAQKASRGKLTVRQVERMATRRARGKVQSQAEAVDPNRQAAIDELQKHIGTRVAVQMPSKGRAGQLILEFYDEEQLNGLYERLMR